MNGAGNPLWRMLEGECINNQYYLQQFLGAGGFGAVYRADDVVADRPTRSVAIKLILIQDLNRQFQELQTAVNLNHANLLRCFTAGQASLADNRGQFLFLVMELASQSLEQFQGAGVITPDALRPIVRDVARGLEALHQEKRIHRDLKPGNVLQVGQTWKIGDFGLVRQINSQASHDSTADLAGTPMYVPPEAFRGQVSTAWDMWSLGVMIVYGLTRELPYRPFNTLQELQQRIMNCQLQIPPLPSPYREIVAGCLRRDRQRRWTATQVLEALGEVNRRPSGRTVITPQGVSRRWVLGALLTGSFVTAVVMGREREAPSEGTRITTTSTPEPTPDPTQTPTTQPTSTQTPQPTATPDPTPVSGLRSESYTFETVTGTDAAGLNGQRRSITVTRWIEDLGNGVLLHLVRIPAGSFMMGSPESEVDRTNNEGSQHGVTFPQDLWMGQFAVTQAQYQVITGQNPSDFKGAQNPVDSVSWDDATAFCERLSDRTGRAYRLPTEAEWEYACRAGTNTPFHFGQSITPDLVNYDGNYPYRNAAKGQYREQTTPVGSFPGNSWGLHDMHGNLWEWCQDEWHDSYAEKPESLKQNGSIAWETTSSSSNTIRVLRGGSWFSNAWYCRSAYRNWYGNNNYYSSGGFRLILAA